MITILRRNQRILMLVIAILTIIAFAWLYNPATPPELRGDAVARIYGKELTRVDVEREMRNYQLTLQMGQYELLGELGGMSQNEQRNMEDFVFNRLVLKHEAKALGIAPTDEQIADFLKSVPTFQTSGQFDPRKYKAFIQEQLGPKGFTEEQLESVARDALNLKELKAVIAAPATAAPNEVEQSMRAYQKIDLQIVQFPVPNADAITVSEDEIKTFYETNKAMLLTPENRLVKFVEFTLPADQAAATGKAKVDATQKLWEAADAFAEQAGKAASFDDAAKAAGLTVKESSEFDRTGTGQAASQIASMLGVEANGEFKDIAPTAFRLNEQKPVSDAVQVGDKFYVVKLEKVTPERPLTLEEVRPRAELQVRMSKNEQQAQEKAVASLATLRDAVAAGKPLADAAKALGLTVETVTGLDPMKAQESGVPMGVVRLSLLMEPAQLSGYLPTQGGGMAVYLTARAPLAGTPEDINKQQNSVRGEMLESAQTMLFVTWLDAARDAAGIAAVPKSE